MISLDFGSASQLSLRAGIARDIPRIARSLRGSRALLVTGNGTLLRNLADSIASNLASVADIKGVVFPKIQSCVPESLVYEAAKVGRDADTDIVIGIGGSSSLAAAKLVACLLADFTGRTSIDDIERRRCKRLPLILMPTTSGSGSEVMPVSTVVTTSHDIKRVVSKELLPDVALLDPEITLDLPWHVTAATGIDAVGRAVEAYRNRKDNLLTDMLAARALKLLVAALPKVLDEPGNLSLRTEMMAGSMLAGMASANSSMAPLQVVALPLANRWFLPPSLASALMLVPVLQFSAPSASADYKQLAAILGFKSRTADGFVDAIKALMVGSNLPIRLKDVGVSKDSFDSMALVASKLAFADSFDMTTADVRHLYEAAYLGW